MRDGWVLAETFADCFRHAEGAQGDEVSVAAKQRQPVKRSHVAEHNEGHSRSVLT
jgi:hypothetical protein